ncbi:MAG: hypothetical protein AB7T63_13550 [Planctomycetota bacterium]
MTSHAVFWSAVVLLLVACVPPRAHADPATIVPEGARIRLEPMRTRWCVGDNVSVRYVVENASDVPFKVEATPPGSDDWWAPQVLDASGEQVISPKRNVSASWPMSSPQVTVARPFARVVSLVRYGVLDRPGRYRVRLFHPLGWKDPDGKRGSGLGDDTMAEDPRWAETWIELVEPTAERVQAVLDVLERYPDDEARRRSTEEVTPRAELLRHPAYLAPLLARLRKTHRSKRHAEAWFRGIHGIPTVEATSALLDLLTTQEHAPWVRFVPPDLCARALLERVPRFVGPGLTLGPDRALGGGPPFSLSLSPGYRERAWSDHLAPRVRAWACEQLDPPGDVLRHALRLLAAVGEPEDWPLVEPRLAHSLDEAQRMPTWPATPEDQHELHGVLQVLSRVQRRGRTPPSAPATAIDIVSTLVWMADHPEEALTHHGELVPAWLDHESALVRALTVVAIPEPLPGFAARKLEALCDDDSAVVRRAALHVVRREPHERYRGGVIRAFGRSDDPDDIQAARRAAAALRIDHVDLLLVDAARLTEASAYPTRWQSLARATGYRGTSPQQPPPPEERQRLARAWREWLRRHREDLGRRGRVVPSEDELRELAPR